jgi:phosphate transport system permease protein
MLLGAPLALLAAIYTSEFLSPRSRSRIKPVVEMMASLPSVVLGFLAALVFAPYVERCVPATLACFVTLPVTYAAAAFIWHLVPYRLSLRIQHYRFVLMCLILPFGFLLAFAIAPAVERFLFAGDVMAWLDGQIGTGLGAWMLLLLPLSGLIVAFAASFTINPILRSRAAHWSRFPFALLNAAKFFTGTLVALLLAWGLSWLLTAAGTDPRGTYVDTYTQRNALVVGFVMGFAIIPIIYTIADDALSTVPNHLRSASLGCGATPWQTAIRVVVPTAMSGLFSALMIGLGRAVGETMIVLMAGGNTPVKDLNLFNGFRTLSANIAVELPEAVRDSTHYRTLFLAALTLFILTFIVNTLAEVVRLRFRRRAYQL